MGRRLPIAGAYTAGWRAGHRAARLANITLTCSFAEADVEAQAAEEARAYMEDAMERRNLLPREGVHLFFSYFDGYRDGVLLRAARRAERAERALPRT